MARGNSNEIMKRTRSAATYKPMWLSPARNKKRQLRTGASGTPCLVILPTDTVAARSTVPVGLVCCLSCSHFHSSRYSHVIDFHADCPASDQSFGALSNEQLPSASHLRSNRVRITLLRIRQWNLELPHVAGNRSLVADRLLIRKPRESFPQFRLRGV